MENQEKSTTVTKAWFVYMVRCNDASLYTGITTDVARRVKEHQGGGKAAKSLRGKGPVQLVYRHEMPDQSQALQVEYKIKQLPKAMKERLVAGKLEIQSLLG